MQQIGIEGKAVGGDAGGQGVGISDGELGVTNEVDVGVVAEDIDQAVDPAAITVCRTNRLLFP